MQIKFTEDDFNDVIYLQCKCDRCVKAFAVAFAQKAFEKKIKSAKKLSGIITKKCEYHGWDEHIGEYDTHQGYLIDEKPLQ